MKLLRWPATGDIGGAGSGSAPPLRARSARFQSSVIVALAAPIAVGAIVSLRGGSAEQTVGLASIAGVPLMVLAAVWAPEALVGFIVFAQILVQFQLPTPVATILPGSVALLVFVAVRLREIIGTVSKPGYMLATILVGLYVAAHALQFLHVAPAPAARQIVTATSVALFVLLGMYIGSRSRNLAAAGIGAAGGLLVLAVLALAQNLHMVPGFVPLSAARDLLWIPGLFVRTYGLSSVPAGQLLALSMPWLACTALFARRLSIRAAAVTGMTVIFLASLLLFQSRSMVLEGLLAPLIVWVLAGRSIPGVVSPTSARQAIRMALEDKRTRTVALIVAGAGVIALVVGASLAVADQVSTMNRTNSYGAAIRYFLDYPWAVMVGTNTSTFHQTVNQTVNAFLAVPDQVSPDAPVHNFIIETLAAGGIVAAVSLFLLAVGPLLVIARAQLMRGRISPAAATAMAAVLVAVVEASVTPAIANSGALWITLGWGVAVAASAADPHDPVVRPR